MFRLSLAILAGSTVSAAAGAAPVPTPMLGALGPWGVAAGAAGGAAYWAWKRFR